MDTLKEILLENTQEAQLQPSVHPPCCSQVMRGSALFPPQSLNTSAGPVTTTWCNHGVMMDNTLKFVYAPLVQDEMIDCVVTISSVMTSLPKESVKYSVSTDATAIMLSQTQIID